MSHAPNVYTRRRVGYRPCDEALREKDEKISEGYGILIYRVLCESERREDYYKKKCRLGSPGIAPRVP